MRSLSREKKDLYRIESDLNPKEIFKKEIFKQGFILKFLKKMTPNINSRTRFWYLDIIYPFMAISVERRLDWHPEEYNFKGTSDSRMKFRKRFKLALGIDH